MVPTDTWVVSPTSSQIVSPLGRGPDWWELYGVWERATRTVQEGKPFWAVIGSPNRETRISPQLQKYLYHRWSSQDFWEGLFIGSIQSLSFLLMMRNYMASSQGHSMRRSDKLCWFSVWRLYRLRMPAPPPTRCPCLIFRTCRYFTRQRGFWRCKIRILRCHIKHFEMGRLSWIVWVSPV